MGVNHKKTRRSAARLLSRLIALDETKIAILEEDGALVQLLSMGAPDKSTRQAAS
eukprot:SAG31_NODE_3825_length_3848_cov_1.551614_4_plen_55_part_00